MKRYYSTPAIRERVLAKYNNRCSYCGCELTDKTMQIDHLKPRSIFQNLANDESNYMPSCRDCNFNKSTFDLEVFRKIIAALPNRIVQTPITGLGVKYGMVEIQKWDGKFYFEKVEASKQNEAS